MSTVSGLLPLPEYCLSRIDGPLLGVRAIAGRRLLFPKQTYNTRAQSMAPPKAQAIPIPAASPLVIAERWATLEVLAGAALAEWCAAEDFVTEAALTLDIGDDDTLVEEIGLCCAGAPVARELDVGEVDSIAEEGCGVEEGRPDEVR